MAWLTPRIPGQPWTAPTYDKLNVPMQTPRVFCMASGHDGHDGCTCLSEQGTRHVIEGNRCRMIAIDGQYEPLLDEVQGDRRRLDDANAAFRVWWNYVSAEDAERRSQWLRRAAQLGDPTSQYNLWFELQSAPDCANRLEAMYWLEKSAAQGNSQAKSRVDAFGSELVHCKPLSPSTRSMTAPGR